MSCKSMPHYVVVNAHLLSRNGGITRAYSIEPKTLTAKAALKRKRQNVRSRERQNKRNSFLDRMNASPTSVVLN